MPTVYTERELPKRSEYDFYPTPETHVEATLEAVEAAMVVYPSEVQYVLDPGAGSGAYGVLKARMPGTHWTGVEVRDVERPAGYDEWVAADYLEWRAPQKYDLVIGNPPYGMIGTRKVRDAALRFVRKAYLELVDGGRLAFLLRLEFLASRRRAAFFDECPPEVVMVCPARPSFTGNGLVAPNEYAVVVWRRGWTGETRLVWSRKAR